ncbi:hypothetical protein BDW02DRAFT_567473 [Decorospora gaudefroyi]|uniref:Uncharacterized protein n=1 Tax=Decorospora gaudefroyi TaxID=184978 RepID=A0A6A5KDA0_9PLEO|nr:hypothetical protein BDW02DRAFT_567473 [Decorospora gaudefroyi]
MLLPTSVSGLALDTLERLRPKTNENVIERIDQLDEKFERLNHKVERTAREAQNNFQSLSSELAGPETVPLLLPRADTRSMSELETVRRDGQKHSAHVAEHDTRCVPVHFLQLGDNFKNSAAFTHWRERTRESGSSSQLSTLTSRQGEGKAQ